MESVFVARILRISVGVRGGPLCPISLLLSVLGGVCPYPLRGVVLREESDLRIHARMQTESDHFQAPPHALVYRQAPDLQDLVPGPRDQTGDLFHFSM